MFALVAAIIWFLAAFGVSPGAVNMVWLGAGFLALHFFWGWYPWRDGSTNRPQN